MRNINLIFNIILSVAVIILFVLFLKKDGSADPSAEKEKADTTETRVTIDPKGSSIVYINSDSLFQQYQFFKENRALTEKERKSMDAQLQGKINEFQKDVEKFRDGAQFMTQEQGLAKQQELMEREQGLAEYRDQLAESLMEKEQTRNDSAFKLVSDYLKRNYTNTNYSYILSYLPGAGSILFCRDSLDITSEVINGLNKEYEEKKKKK